MRFLPTAAHGMLDYAVGLLIAGSPWLFGFARGGAETWVPLVLGLGAVGYSLLTDYEWGLRPVISMPVHLWLDTGSGVLLAASPWLFGFADAVWVPHLMFGLFEVAAGLTTRTRPETSRRPVSPDFQVG